MAVCKPHKPLGDGILTLPIENNQAFIELQILWAKMSQSTEP